LSLASPDVDHVHHRQRGLQRARKVRCKVVPVR